ncbi:MAG: hypothetical protein JXA78_19825 [Anaerolineales bacterium]|nr:hypothetical protein [Anaerolineales bacterium]
MRKATRIAAASFGLFAGFGGVEHGIFEMLQGNIRPGGIMIASMGPPCQPDRVWNACEPAMTIFPNFFVTGLLAIILGVVTMIWSLGFIQRKRGGGTLVLLSVLLLLFGGGMIPPVIGAIGGWVGTRINAPLPRRPAGSAWGVTLGLSRLWPWPLVLFFIALFSQFVIGYFFNDWFMENGFIILALILGLFILSILSAQAYDLRAMQNSREVAL